MPSNILKIALADYVLSSAFAATANLTTVFGAPYVDRPPRASPATLRRRDVAADARPRRAQLRPHERGHLPVDRSAGRHGRLELPGHVRFRRRAPHGFHLRARLLGRSE